MLGSSKTYKTPVNPLPICDAKRILCASPPESEPAWRERVKYDKPTSLKKLSLSLISLIMPFAIIWLVSLNFKFETIL